MTNHVGAGFSSSLIRGIVDVRRKSRCALHPEQATDARAGAQTGTPARGDRLPPHSGNHTCSGTTNGSR